MTLAELPPSRLTRHRPDDFSAVQHCRSGTSDQTERLGVNSGMAGYHLRRLGTAGFSPATAARVLTPDGRPARGHDGVADRHAGPGHRAALVRPDDDRLALALARVVRELGALPG
ncbi:hypothetical protein MTP10_39285 [Nonomuraea sp. 3-1Str]|uniref:hypothetical protein n=1 Tax=Nonomuraea sp. 3-1Str TaxID=2929801 RepID=UPI0028618A9A|nr:hypothetical protein [Nonomuraea sp. 3-1Str]MDR8414758.1 hypothetical protein [Nonomuraea sp. 3-1Str]